MWCACAVPSILGASLLYIFSCMHVSGLAGVAREESQHRIFLQVVLVPNLPSAVLI